MGNPATATSVGIGTVLAETYEVVALLGRGGMGTVWQAHHARLPGKKVAIKVLHGEVAADPESLARFRREAEIASRLGHPNIVEVHDFNNLPDGSPYLVLEYLRGEPLDARLARGPLSLDEVSGIVRQVGSALAAAHREDIIHRDLKPQNIFLVETEVGGHLTEIAKVLDFGISKIRGSQTVKTQDSAILGTPQYMAPEQATGRHDQVDARTDVFALGAIVYEMLAGKPAFAGTTIPEVVFKVVYEEPQSLREVAPGVSEPVAAVVHRALSKNSDDRFPDVSAFVEALTGTPLTTVRRGAVVSPAAGMSDEPGIATDRTMAPPSTGRGRSVQSPIATDRTMAATGDQAAAITGKDALAATVDSGRHPTPLPQPPAAIAEPDVRPGPPGSKLGIWIGIAGVAIAIAAVAALVLLRGGDTRPSGTVDPLEPPGAITAQAPESGQAGAGVTAPPVDPTIPAVPDETATGAADTTGTEPTDSKTTSSKSAASKTTSSKSTGDSKSGDSKSGDSKAGAAENAGDDSTSGQPPATGDDADDGASKDALADLARAEKALRAGELDRAIHVARRALQHKPRPRAAFAILTRAYCAKSDLGAANTWWPNVPRRLRRSVKQYCSEQGIELD